jgi:alpha-beta hydrolase superfamily lysophospholipase
MQSLTRTVHAADGTPILTRRWPVSNANAPDAPWAHVLLVHGLGEHSGRYQQVAEWMATAGLAVHAYDHRGSGASGGRRGHVDLWSQLHDDLTERVAAVTADARSRPVVLYGHSLGGLVVAGYCLLTPKRPTPDLVVLTSPGLDSTLAEWKKRMAAVLGRFTPTLGLPNGIDGRTLSRDPSVAEKLAKDPLCCTTSTFLFGAEGLQEQDRVRKLASRGLGVPTLVLHGEDDGLVPEAASRVFEGAPGVTRKTYPGLRHELHNEPEGESVVSDVIAWLRQEVREG